MFQEMTFSFMGFIGKAETRTANGTSVSTLRVAVTEGWNDGDGNRRERTHWFTLTSFSKSVAQLIEAGDMTKGRYIVARGDIRENRWTDKDGTERLDIQFIVHRIHFAQPKPAGE